MSGFYTVLLSLPFRRFKLVVRFEVYEALASFFEPTIFG